MNGNVFFTVSILLLSIGCRKGDQPVRNDAQIEDRIVNISLSNNGGSNDSLIDLNGDGTDDFRLYSSLPGAIATNSQIGINSVNNFEFATTVSGFIAELMLTFPQHTIIDASSGTWKADAIFYFHDASLTLPNQFGFNNVGDKLIAFRTKRNGQYFYGWMEVNVHSDHSVDINEYGLYLTGGNAIQAGTR